MTLSMERDSQALVRPYGVSDSSRATHELHMAAAPEGALPTVVVVDRRPLFAECLLVGLQALDQSNQYKYFASIRDWLPNHDIGTRTVVLLCMNDERLNAPPDRDLAEARDVDPSVRFVIMGDQEDPRQVLKALELGAQGYIPTSIPLKVVIQALHLVRAGGIFVPASSMQKLAAVGLPKAGSQKGDLEAFSPRQVSVARALRKGTPNKVIAYELNMCESTVKVHVRQIMKKLKAKNRTEVAFLTNHMFPTDAG
jgi:DNA-binding NarL/FixJ family response regulator